MTLHSSVPDKDRSSIDLVRSQFAALKTHIEQAIIGQPRLIERLLTGVLADGHVLLEGLPGLAKTTAVRALASGMNLRFQRIQFTPDLIPGDITGSDIFVPQDGHFQFIEGPIFNDIILADEINRAPPKVQSALLEAMQERQVTVGGVTRELSPQFMVIATQNPIEHEGTYPLPEAQLDRFLMKTHIDYPSADDELAILHLEQQRLTATTSAPSIMANMTPEQVLQARAAVCRIYIDEMLERYIITLVGATRNPAAWDPELAGWISRGASPRASLALAHAARARAYLSGRDFVEPGDIIDLAHDILNHRIALNFSARAAEVSVAQVIERIIEAVPIP